MDTLSFESVSLGDSVLVDIVVATLAVPPASFLDGRMISLLISRAFEVKLWQAEALGAELVSA
jgi:hypothetical protein